MSLDWASGEVVTAAKLNSRQPRRVVKAADENLASSIVLQNDDELFFDLAAGRTYRIEANILASGATAGDIQLAWTTTGTISLVTNRTCLGPAVAATVTSDTTMRAARATTLATAVNYGIATSAGYIRETFEVSVTVAGRLTLQWAQVTSSGTATTVSGGSWLSATPVD